MKKYDYKYCVYKNNLRDGTRFVCAYDSLINALNKKEYLQSTGGGCCVVVKKKFLKGSTTPIITNISNNHWYSEHDL